MVIDCSDGCSRWPFSKHCERTDCDEPTDRKFTVHRQHARVEEFNICLLFCFSTCRRCISFFFCCCCIFSRVFPLVFFEETEMVQSVRCLFYFYALCIGLNRNESHSYLFYTYLIYFFQFVSFLCIIGTLFALFHIQNSTGNIAQIYYI